MPKGEIFRRIGEVVYVRFVLDQCESRWQLKVVEVVDYGGIDFDFAAAWIGCAASECCCGRRWDIDRFRCWRSGRIACRRDGCLGFSCILGRCRCRFSRSCSGCCQLSIHYGGRSYIGGSSWGYCRLLGNDRRSRICNCSCSGVLPRNGLGHFGCQSHTGQHKLPRHKDAQSKSSDSGTRTTLRAADERAGAFVLGLRRNMLSVHKALLVRRSVFCGSTLRPHDSLRFVHGSTHASRVMA